MSDRNVEAKDVSFVDYVAGEWEGSDPQSIWRNDIKIEPDHALMIKDIEQVWSINVRAAHYEGQCVIDDDLVMVIYISGYELHKTLTFDFESCDGSFGGYTQQQLCRIVIGCASKYDLEPVWREDGELSMIALHKDYDKIRAMQEIGLSSEETIDVLGVVSQRNTQKEWADKSGKTQQAVSKNLNSAKDTINELEDPLSWKNEYFNRQPELGWIC